MNFIYTTSSNCMVFATVCYMLALILLYENFFLLHDTGKVDRDSDLEQCNANNNNYCVIEDAPSNMKVVKWLN